MAGLDKAGYLARKREREAGQAEFKRARTCWRCWWPEAHCWCPIIKPFETETRFVLLMHPKEARRERAGTGRLTQAHLPNSEIIIGVDFSEDPRVNALIADPGNLCLVLYPGAKSLDISKDDVSPLQARKAEGRRLVLFLIDGTWQCAKKMITLSRNVRLLPRLSFAVKRESIFEIKEQPAAYCLSTLESVHEFLNEADRRGLERLPGRPQDNLITVFKAMIDFMIACSVDPEKASYRRGPKGYSPRATRKKRSKKSGRGILLKD